ncbi:PREDICTED: uncharacterized protein LOC108778723, partial [Cyphomyrmex costatus]|uniref:uncharacterized protein LOC108778723 n=1 Tax=Cyphomyrmex costatus TaxID=456900 RepID=UPI0008524338
MSIPARIEQVKKKKACINCLRSGHFAINCKSQKCRKCSKSHNTLLHLGTEVAETKSEENKQVVKAPEVKNENKEVISAHSAVKNSMHLLLPTAMVRIISKDGRIHRCSALLDSGSQSNFITTNLCNKLGLHTNEVNFTVAGINQSQTKILEMTKATIQSMYEDYEKELTFMVMPRITSNLPSESVDVKGTNIPANIPLADPSFHKPKRIDILIGVDHFWDLMCHEPSNHPYLHKTKLGYIVSGKFPQQRDAGIIVSCNLSTSTAEISRNLEQFWKVEELPEQSHLSTEEQGCESHFMSTTKRDNTGRFIVSIPFKASPDMLGDSKELALKRFKSVERRLLANEEMRGKYIAFMQRYQELGHMKKVIDDYSAIQTCYLPHHGVVKEDSLTTKLRVVFDASAPTATGISLNDIQMVGPTIQRDLISIILSFRQYPYVIGADIAMMYRQILIEPSQ